MSRPAFLLIVSCSTSSDIVRGEVVRTTICELTANPKGFDGARVDVVAQVESDGLEHTTLIDESCPERGVTPDVSEAVRNSPDLKALQDAMFRGRPGTLDKKIAASFRGVFRWYPKRTPSRVLTLEAVTNLSVEPKT